ncbi:MAG: winged helix DNA-binding domain-containing protein [Nocardioides sp.]
MERRISVEERRARLARRHRLLPALRTDDVALIADDLVALHSTDPVTVYLSAMLRMRHPCLDAVEQALYDDRTLVRHHAMRRTLWVATPDVVRLMHAAATRRLAAPQHRRTVKLLEANGVADGERWMRDAKAQVLAELHDHGPLTARALGERIPDLRHPLEMAPGKSYNAVAAAHTRVLVQLGFEGEIMRARPVGSWLSGQYTWAATDSWLPGGLSGLDEREAARGLAERWLRAFGPGTSADLQWWAGWTAAMTRRALADCGAVPVELEPAPGETVPGWVAAGDEDPVEPVEPWVALLPGLDPTTMGWKERGFYLPAECADAFDANGNAGPTVWVDGRVVGAWAQTAEGEIRTHLLVDVDPAARDAVARRAEELREMLGDSRHTVRFPPRVHPVLLS